MLSPLERDMLRQAREMIRTGFRHRICYALNEAYRAHRYNPRALYAVDRLKIYIHRKLGYEPSLDYWQENRGIWRTEEQKRQDRLDWIDWMLGRLK